MRLEKKIFQSKISLRIFATFVTCALLPVVCLAILVYFQVTDHLSRQTLRSLHQAVKSHSRTLLNRLELVEDNLRLLSSVADERILIKTRAYDDIRSKLLNHFKNITLFSGSNQPFPLLNQSAIKPLQLEPDDIKHMSAGKPLLMELNAGQSSSSIMILRQFHFESAINNFYVGEINLNYLWGINQYENLPMDTEFCILDSSNKILYSSLSTLSENEDKIRAKIQNSISGNFEFYVNEEPYFASYSQMFLKPTYKLPYWTVILLKAKSDTFAPIAKFKIVFPSFLIFTIMLVLWLSIGNIRKNLIPIAVLKDGAKRIAKRDFHNKVSIASGDEFEELAVAFNDMAAAIEHKFKTLDAKAEIDNAVLSTLSREDMVNVAIVHISDLITCDVCGINIVESDNASQSGACCRYKQDNQDILASNVEIKPHEFMTLKQNAEYFVIHSNDPVPHYLPALSCLGNLDYFIFPIRVKTKLAAVLWLGIKTDEHPNAEEVKLLRQLGDQIAVALSNSSLLAEQKEMNWGTLQALARTVDAKSPWTAGHSQRVTEMALKIGYALKLEPESIENLHRAALLHDIGKVGVPSAILDKPSKLNDDEYRIIKRHPGLGVKIISPIKAFKKLTPIVGQHHERFDGKGYPGGLSGEAINMGARILAVADVYDAMSSDRPYRKGLSLSEVLNIMQREAGHQFDPLVVNTLIKVIKEDNRKAA
jgi:putative nucleotidyltransferase with HDIG domain